MSACNSVIQSKSMPAITEKELYADLWTKYVAWENAEMMLFKKFVKANHIITMSS
jgi:hypothetical protein